MAGPAIQRPASAAETGRACPYCRFPLKEGDAVCECGACHSLHHSDCWSDNSGCAIVACTGAGAAQAAAAPAGPPAPPMPSPPGQQPTPVAAAPARREPWLALALFVLALAIAGAGAAYFVTAKEDDDEPRRVAQTTTSPTVPAPEPAPETDVHEPPPPDPSEQAEADRAEIERVLTDYYDAIRAGDYDTAWGLLSPSYKEWKSANGGRSKWEGQEAATNEIHLGPTDGLSVEIKEYDPDTEIAEIYVSGLTYEGTCDYSGYTWARRFDGQWYYDQGYVQDPERTAKWRPRQDETLGVPCEDGSY